MPEERTDDSTTPGARSDAGGDGAAAPVVEPRTRETSHRGAGGFAVLRVLRHREYALFWAGQAVSLVGTWMQSFAQGWVVANLTTSALALGLVNFAMSVPTLVLMPFGGVAADRLERRRILIYTQWVMLALAVAMGALVSSGRLELWHVWVVALLLGVATAYDLPAYQSFYPQLVEREDLPQAISLNQATFHAARVIGPGLAGWMVARWGTAAAFYANAASFLAVVASLLMIRPRPPAAGGGRTSTGEMMREGLRYVRERPELQALLGLTGITTLFIFPNMAVLSPYYVKHVLHAGPGALGSIMSVSGMGAFLGAALLLSVPAERRLPHIVAGIGTIVISTSALAWSRQVPVSVGAVAFQSVAISHSLGLVSIMVQETVPDALRGRVMSLYSLTFTGIMPFGALLIPGVADWIGMRLELQIAAVLYAAGALLFMARLRRRGE
jgi:MFS family permease